MKGKDFEMNETLALEYDVPRLLDAYEAHRAELWRIAFRAERARAAGDLEEGLADIEKWAMTVLTEPH